MSPHPSDRCLAPLHSLLHALLFPSPGCYLAFCGALQLKPFANRKKDCMQDMVCKVTLRYGILVEQEAVFGVLETKRLETSAMYMRYHGTCLSVSWSLHLQLHMREPHARRRCSPEFMSPSPDILRVETVACGNFATSGHVFGLFPRGGDHITPLGDQGWLGAARE